MSYYNVQSEESQIKYIDCQTDYNLDKQNLRETLQSIQQPQ